MKKLILIISLIPSFLLAQTATTITGTVKDKKTAEALIGATVNIKGTSKGAATDFEGAFKIKVTESFPVVLVFSYMGYMAKEVTINNLAEASKPLAVKLEENTKELKELEITDTRITERQKQAPLTIETMDAVSIKETPAANFYEGLAHLKGVDLTSASIGFKIINTRGFNSTSPVRSLQLIDGVDNQSPGLNFSLGNFLGASELDVQRVDLIVGASSAYYGPSAFNGVINMQTKNPFLFKGLSAQIRVGERNLTEAAVRYANVIKNKKGEDKFAYKINLFAMRANDWEATNYNSTIQSPVGSNNPGGFDAVNIYGDEFSTNRFRQTGLVYLGHGYTMREGYRERDLVDYNSHNIKFNATAHYKFYKDHEIIAATSISNGTTVYQGENRFSLKDIWFYQNRIEVKKEGSYFIRAYATHEDAGNSYDAYNTALLLQRAAKNNNDWAIDYAENWNTLVFNRIQGIRPPIGSQPPGVRYEDFANQYLFDNFYDSLVLFHRLVRAYTDTTFSPNRPGVARFEPGTERFDSAFRAITSLTNRQGGSRFFDRSALYHVAAEKIFTPRNYEIKIGGNFRLYAPNSQGTIFLDTAENQRIFNREFGSYLGIERKIDLPVKAIGELHQLKFNFTTRLDKNQNFNALVSPAFTAVYTKNQHVFRATASSAVRNPTLADQYINLNVGPATLLGNLKGFDSLVTINSMLDAFNNGRGRLEYFNVDPVRPERVRTLEAGYRTTLWEKVFVDASYYFSWYTDFLGFKIGADLNWPQGDPFVRGVNVYRVTTNSKDVVTTQGFTIGLNYFFKKYLGFSGNYSWNKLDRRGSTDPLIPAFNTPEHKYNLGINGRDITSNIGNFFIRNWGYGFNYKWQEGFLFEGSPQFTGFVDAYDLLDVQVNKSYKDGKFMVKIGANNLLNNRVIQVYGGPAVGRLAYFSLVMDLK